MKRLLFFSITFFCLSLSMGLKQTSAQNTASVGLSQSEEVAKREIQARLDASIEAMKKKDMASRLEMFAPGYTAKLKDGDTMTRQDMERYFARQNSIISISDETRTVIDNIKLNGNEATIHISQRFVRTVPGADNKPVEVRTSVTHREVWVKTEKGWLVKYIEELEQGPTFVNGVEALQDRAGWKFVKIVWEEGVERALAVFKEARKRDPQAILFQEPTLNNLGYRLIQKGRIKDAIRIFELNTEAYPLGFNTYDSLAEAYMLDGDKQLAIKNYKKSLELNPKNTNAVTMLEKLTAPPKSKDGNKP
jgi:tetratricopeptide (TPR) repeat protein